VAVLEASAEIVLGMAAGALDPDQMIAGGVAQTNDSATFRAVFATPPSAGVEAAAERAALRD
jgi:hypothetical protein